jgi:geranylgeranyl diphosphate synthase type II
MKDLSQRLNNDIALIEAELDRVLTALSERRGFGGNYCRELFRFTGHSARTVKPLTDAMGYSLTSGGKRIRPVLTLEFCRLFGGNEETALRMGAALEMVHTYSLIHDDLPCMDNDDFRRGKPTNHKVYGEATAVLAGDSLLTEAFSLLSNGIDGQEKRYMNAIGILSESAGALGMAGGQQMDLAGESAPLTREEHTEMTLRKTGELIRAACLLGCAASDADTEKRMAAEKYAYGIGLSFQIIDDILDAGTEDGKTTFLTFYTEDEAKALARELTDSAINAIKGYGGSDTLIALAEYLHSRKI